MGTSIEWFSLITGILGGLVFFLYGMELMSNALKSGLGDYIRVLITKFNSSNFKMMFTGILVTVITQSTGATTVMLMSFVEANIMKFAETVPVILGACIGSSVTSQIIAFDVAGYAIVPVIAGFFMKSSKKDSLRDTGNAIFGFGLVFFGMQLLGKSVSILKDIPEFTNAIASADNPILGLLVGTIGTCIMQSTGMFAGILMVFAKEGLIDISQAYPLVIGSTLGTCLLIVIASVGGTTQSKRTMMAHVLTKCAGAAIFMLLMPLMVAFIEWVCNAVACSPERRIANIHLIFNIGEAFVLLPFCGVFVKIIEKWVKPVKPSSSKDKVKTSGYLKYIDHNVISVPQTAIESSISETAMLIKLCSRIFDKATIVFEDYNPDNIDAKRLNQKTLKRLADKQQTFKYVQEEVSKYLFIVGRKDIQQSTSKQIYGIMSVLEQLERILETIMGGLVPLYDKLCRLDMTFSTEGVSEIKVFIWAINNHFRELFTAIEKHDAKQIASVAQAIELTRHNTESLRMSHIKRLWNDDHQAVSATHEVHTQLIDTLASITTILSSITATSAKSIITDDSAK
ncbi:MAG: Na/Pi cotransporter family protein [Bacteroidales bacterium]|nr:Na/Pi cotransporter family protein [Bacteroidales bacterium]